MSLHGQHQACPQGHSQDHSPFASIDSQLPAARPARQEQQGPSCPHGAVGQQARQS